MLEIRIESNVSGIFTGIFSVPIWCKFISRDFRLKRRVYRAFSGLLQFVFHGFRLKAAGNSFLRGGVMDGILLCISAFKGIISAVVIQIIYSAVFRAA